MSEPQDTNEAAGGRSDSTAVLEGWISAADQLPETKPHVYMCEMSELVLVRGEGKNSYPWVAHLHVDKATTYKEYAWGFDKDGVRYTWLSPYREICDNQKITHWRALPSNAEITGRTLAKNEADGA